MENEIKLPKKVAKFLENSAVKFTAVEHRIVYTAFDKSATLKVIPAVIAKVLTVKIDGEMAMAVVGGDKNLDTAKLLKLAKAKKMDFAKEKQITDVFKGIDPGAIPPFTGLWGLKAFCDKKLLEQAKLILSAGDYETSLEMTPGAFKKANPEMVIGNFSVARPKPKAQQKSKAKPKQKRATTSKKSAKKKSAAKRRSK